MKISRLRLLRIGAAILLTMAAPKFLAAQENVQVADDAPLGDVARNLRKQAPVHPVIDNDNLNMVMDQAQGHRASGSSVQYSIDGGGKTFQVSAPDVTCRLSFSPNSKALLSTQYTQARLPPAEMAKLEGPAIIDGDSLQLSVFNGTDWHVSELAIALTLVKRVDPSAETSGYGAAKLVPAIAMFSPEVPSNPAEKPPDVTTVYHVRAAAAPATTTVFRTPLDLEIGSDQEWHWAIVEAKGYPPQPSPAMSSVAPPQ